MADGGGASGVLGVLVGAMLVLFIGAGVLDGTGTIGATRHRVSRSSCRKRNNPSEDRNVFKGWEKYNECIVYLVGLIVMVLAVLRFSVCDEESGQTTATYSRHRSRGTSEIFRMGAGAGWCGRRIGACRFCC